MEGHSIGTLSGSRQKGFNQN